MLSIFSTPLLIGHLCQLETVVFLHWCIIRVVLFLQNFATLTSWKKIWPRALSKMWHIYIGQFLIIISLSLSISMMHKLKMKVILKTKLLETLSAKCEVFWSSNMTIFFLWRFPNIAVSGMSELGFLTYPVLFKWMERD